MLGKRSAGIVAAAAALALSLTACGGGGTGSTGGGQAGAGTGTLTLGALVPATTQSAADANWANESPYVQAVYDSLLHATPDAKIEPWLATEWSYNDDKTVADDDAARRRHVHRRRRSSPPTWRPRTSCGSATGSRRTSRSWPASPTRRRSTRRTLEITLKQPDPALLNYLTQNAGLAGQPEVVRRQPTPRPTRSAPARTCSTPPSTVIGSKYVFTKNPNYWAQDQQHYDNLVINVYHDPRRR